MVKIANLSADLTANTSSFDTNLTKARRSLRTTSRSMTKSASNFDKSISSSFKRAAQSTAALEGPLGGVAGRLSALSTIAGSVGLVVGGTALAIAAAGLAIAKTIRVGDKWEGNLNRINAILKSTGSASGQTADQIREFSRELALGTLASVQGVEQAAAKLLTFRTIAGDTFKRTLTLAQDLAATGFGSLSDNVTQLGKALEDPIRNLGALTRNGVSFTQAQKDVIKALVETGRQAEAQGIILDALAIQVGGAAAAEGGALAKSLDVVSQKFEELFVQLDQGTGASGGFAKLLDFYGQYLGFLKQEITPPTLSEDLEREVSKLNKLKSLLDDEPITRRGQEQQSRLPAQIEEQKRVIEELVVAIRKEKEETEKLTQAARAKSAAVQAGLVADKKAEIAAKEAAKAEKDRVKFLEAKNKRIGDVIEGLNIEVNALEAQKAALDEGNVSIDDSVAARQALSVIQRLGIADNTIEADVIRGQIADRARLSQAIARETQLRARGKQILDQNRTSQQKLRSELAKIEELRREGIFSEAEYQKLISITKDKIGELADEESGLTDTLKDLGQSAQSAFESFVLGSRSAADALKEFGASLASNLLKKATGSIFESVTGSLVKNIFGGFFADGGRPPIGKVSVVGEDGPELFVPDMAGTVIPNGGAGPGGGPVFKIDARGASVEAVMRLERLVERLNGSIEPRAVSAVVSEQARNPQLLAR